MITNTELTAEALRLLRTLNNQRPTPRIVRLAQKAATRYLRRKARMQERPS